MKQAQLDVLFVAFVVLVNDDIKFTCSTHINGWKVSLNSPVIYTFFISEYSMQ